MVVYPHECAFYINIVLKGFPKQISHKSRRKAGFVLVWTLNSECLDRLL